MKNIKSTLLVICAAILILVLPSFRYIVAPSSSTIAVIVNKDNPVNTLTAGEVKLYWLRKIKSRWPDINKNIRPVDRKTKCNEQEIFYWKVLGMMTDDVETYFITRQYQNAQKPQDKFQNDKEIIDFVGDEIGAIGYVNENSLSAEAKARVKVVFTIGN